MSIATFDLEAEALGTYVYSALKEWRPNNNGSHTYQTIEAGIGRTGGKGMRIGFSHASTEATKSYRAELQSYQAGTGSSKEVTAESWLSVSYKFDSFLPTDDSALMIFQYHQGLGTPPLLLLILDQTLYLSNRHYKLAALNRSTLAVTESSDPTYREYFFKYPLIEIPIGEWFDIAMQVIPQTYTYPASAYDGTFRLWINGTLLVDIATDMIMHNFYDISDDPLLANIKMGQYISDWVTGAHLPDGDPALERYCTIDNIKWGTAGTVLADLMPVGGWATTVDLSTFIPIVRTSEEIAVAGDPLVMASYPANTRTVMYPGSDASHARIRKMSPI